MGVIIPAGAAARASVQGYDSKLHDPYFDGVSDALADKGFVVAELKTVTPADHAQNKGEIKTIEDQLQTALNDDLFNQYIAALKQRYTVKINREAVDSVVSTGG